MATYRLTPKAREGVHEILEYVARRFGTRVAEEVLDRLAAGFELVAEHPERATGAKTSRRTNGSDSGPSARR